MSDGRAKPLRIAIVYGTYNRIEMLKRAVASVRFASRGLGHSALVDQIIVDGGSTDGSIEWLVQQPDVITIQQVLPLTGAVAAFNRGFAMAVDLNYDYIGHLNDDAEIVTEGAFASVLAIFDLDPMIGEVAFAYDLYRPGDFKIAFVNGRPYANYGLIRREAGMAVAREQGDPDGRLWWNPIYRTYGADTEFGVQLWCLGWRVHPARHIHVRDHNARDAIRELNEANKDDTKLFWSRWRNWIPPI